eukprot:m.411331 g.411331  ORF g.411331 m.411331 type:complete len:264 (-) comp28634_c0_seq1:416-1207(-)
MKTSLSTSSLAEIQRENNPIVGEDQFDCCLTRPASYIGYRISDPDMPIAVMCHQCDESSCPFLNLCARSRPRTARVTMPGLPFNPLGLKLALFTSLTVAIFSTIGGNFSYNPVVFTILLWATYKPDDYESLFISMMMIMLSVLLDIVVLSVFGPWDYYPGIMKFGMAMNIIGILLKPWVLYIVYTEFHIRGGDLNAYIPFIRRSDAYEPMVDQPPNYQGFASASQSGAPGGGQNGYQSGQAQPLAPQQHAHPAKAHDPDAAPF